MHFLVVKLAFGHLAQQKLSRFFLILSFSAILLMNAFLFMLYGSLGKSFDDLKATRHVTAFFSPTASDSELPAVVSAIEKKPGVLKAQLVSREEFLKRFSSLFPDASSEVAQADPDAVPRYLKVRVTQKVADTLAEDLKKNPLIESVEQSTQRLSGVLAALANFRMVVLVLVAMLSLALMSLLLNHFKLSTQLALQMKRTLKSLGAKRHIMLLPYFIEGAVEGTIAGLLAAAAMIAVGSAFQARMIEVARSLGHLPQQYDLLPAAAALLIAGFVLGVAGSLWAMANTKK